MGTYCKHGMSYHPAYKVWVDMKRRCYNTANARYADYGGRGIQVCKRWVSSFATFWKDMGKCYRKGLILDRENNNGNYSKSNCRWLSPTVSSRNKRNNHWVRTPWGKLTITDAAACLGISTTALRYRLSAWPRKKLFEPRRVYPIA